MIGKIREISLIKGARKDFEDFPQGARDDLLDAMTVVTEGGHPSIAKLLQGPGAGVLELALKHRGDAYRVVYPVQKKWKSDIAIPKPEIDLVRERLKRPKEALQ